MYTHFSNIYKGYIIPKDLWEEALNHFNKKNWLRYNQLIKQVYPQNIKKYIKNQSYTIEYNDNEKYEIKVVYDKLSKEYNNYAYVRFHKFSSNKQITRLEIEDLHITPLIMMLPKRCIDFLIAHELAHVKRFLENRYKTKLLKRTELNYKNEEYWADREAKKMLAIVDPIYNNKNERRKTLLMASLLLKRGQFAGVFSAFGKLTDILMPFSNTIN